MNANQEKALTVAVGDADFESEVLRSACPVVVAFCAPWSRPCHIIEAELEQVAVACAGRVKVARVNADDNPELSLWYDVQSVPTLLYFVAGNLSAKLVGTASKEAILSRLQAVSQGGKAGSARSSSAADHGRRDS